MKTKIIIHVRAGEQYIEHDIHGNVIGEVYPLHYDGYAAVSVHGVRCYFGYAADGHDWVRKQHAFHIENIRSHLDVLCQQANECKDSYEFRALDDKAQMMRETLVAWGELSVEAL